jgi:hypothetical protein
LNLVGVLAEGKRIPGSHTASVAIWRGRFVAARAAGQTEFYEEIDVESKARMSRALERGLRDWAEPTGEELTASETAPPRFWRKRLA